MMRSSPIRFQEPNEPFLAYGVEEQLDVGVQNDVHLPALDRDHERIECIVLRHRLR